MTNSRADPVGPVGAAVRRAQRDTPINPSRAAKLLEVDPSDQSTETVANEIDATTPDVFAKVLPQGQGSLIDSSA